MGQKSRTIGTLGMLLFDYCFWCATFGPPCILLTVVAVLIVIGLHFRILGLSARVSVMDDKTYKYNRFQLMWHSIVPFPTISINLLLPQPECLTGTEITDIYLLDLFLTSIPQCFSLKVTSPLGSSDHCVVTAKCKQIFLAPSAPFHRTVGLYRYSKAA